ncbi:MULTISPECIES: LysR family transcriptional regulator [unclassified Niallia]|uniref:LysR family transcriptional regulator n=1 Tax=unclassified Niallia TaxID=2837522 RepID=UPI001EDAE459|nr:MULTISPECIES: LysR family transcriptional regulator [unclassified Niallia]MCM3029138.1 LysR family transcriptional regulator [Niallia sp. MER 6]MDL0434975.1 LysR family transcriptional regulator [Niallia sp. SS-2023]UPO88782.1 LysR family transcriptional regulator [Niallia sp. Man26]
MSTISELQLLKVLAQEMNMRKAAEKLFVSQPALSQRLQNIEKEWGAKLFIRSQKGLSLTAAGELVAQFAIETINKEDSVKESIHALKGEVHGTLSIAAASIVGQNWLPGVLKEFIKTYPQAKVSLITGWSSEILKSMTDGSIHLGIIRGSADWKGAKKHLFDDPLYLVDSQISSLDQLMDTDRPFIQFKSDSSYYEEIQEWWHRQFPAPPKNTIYVDQIETCKQLTFNGIGYSILPAIALKEANQNLFQVPLLDEKNQPIFRSTWLIGYEAAFQLKQVQAFFEIIEEYVAGEKRAIREGNIHPQ